MKYTSLKSDIINILHSSDYNLNLKFYDENGNTTLNPDDAQWGYINNNNMVIEFMSKDEPIIYIWKNKENVDSNMKSIIQRIRELSVLNGVSVQIRVYDNLDQRKIYNLIKTNIVSKKDEEVNESVDNKNSLIEAFQAIISTAKNTKKPSDFYMSESVLNKNAESILQEMFNEIIGLKSLKNVKLNETFSQLSLANNYTEIKNVIDGLNKSTLNKLYESINDIKNIASFVRQKYLNNTPFSNHNNTIMVLENVKVYDDNIETQNNNLIKAYNHLISVCEGALSDITLLRHIKNNKILETYNVKKEDLINFWLENDGKKLDIHKCFVIENYLGEKFSFSDKLSFGLKSLANYFNNNGEKDSKIYNNIISETIKYNDISDFIINYKDDYNVRKFIPKFKKIFNETISKLSSNDFNKSLFESVDESLDYSIELDSLIQKIGVEHNAIKYLALEEAKENAYKSKILMEEKENDIQTLVNELKNYSTYSSVVACHIVENRLNINSQLNESVNDELTIAKSIYQKLYNNTDKVSTSVASTLFGIINIPKKLNKSKKNFIKTLVKYC